VVLNYSRACKVTKELRVADADPLNGVKGLDLMGSPSMRMMNRNASSAVTNLTCIEDAVCIPFLRARM
jgi:hypothetical protein